jgi:hypothetical protein
MLLKAWKICIELMGMRLQVVHPYEPLYAFESLAKRGLSTAVVLEAPC